MTEQAGGHEGAGQERRPVVESDVIDLVRALEPQSFEGAIENRLGNPELANPFQAHALDHNRWSGRRAEVEQDFATLSTELDRVLVPGIRYMEVPNPSTPQADLLTVQHYNTFALGALRTLRGELGLTEESLATITTNEDIDAAIADLRPIIDHAMDIVAVPALHRLQVDVAAGASREEIRALLVEHVVQNPVYRIEGLGEYVGALIQTELRKGNGEGVQGLRDQLTAQTGRADAAEERATAAESHASAETERANNAEAHAAAETQRATAAEAREATEKARADAATQRAQTAEAEKALKDQQIDELRRQLTEQKNAHDAALAAAENKTREAEQRLADEKEKHRREIEEKDLEIAHQSGRIRNLEGQNTNLTQELDRTEKERLAALEEAKQAKAEAAAATAAAAAKDARILELEEGLGAAIEAARQLEQKNQTLTKRNDVLVNENAGLHEDLDRTSREFEALRQDHLKLEQSHATLQTEHASVRHQRDALIDRYEPGVPPGMEDVYANLTGGDADLARRLTLLAREQAISDGDLRLIEAMRESLASASAYGTTDAASRTEGAQRDNAQVAKAIEAVVREAPIITDPRERGVRLAQLVNLMRARAEASGQGTGVHELTEAIIDSENGTLRADAEKLLRVLEVVKPKKKD